MEKSKNVLRSKTRNRHTAFKITIRVYSISRRLLRVFYQGWYLHNEKETSFLTWCIENSCLTATSLFEIWTLAWSSASTSRFQKGIFFFSWQNGTLSFFFGPVIFFRFWFYMSRDLHQSKLIITCYYNYHYPRINRHFSLYAPTNFLITFSNRTISLYPDEGLRIPWN